MRLSSFSYYADFFISAALIIYFAHRMVFEPWRTCAEWLACAALGVALWTLAEYVIHRWVYHHVPYFKDAHDAHHAEPNAFIGAPPILGVLLIVAVFYAAVVELNPLVAAGLTTGVLIGYCAYQLMHHADHHWLAAPTSWLYRARHHHALHHYHSEHANFGITTSFWNRVFGTAAKTERRKSTA